LRAVLLMLATATATASLCARPAEANGQAPGPAGSPEIRAVWVDAFHAGIRSADEAAQLVADAKRLYLNTLIVQVRRRGDALYTDGLEPPLDDPHYDPSFDALRNVVELAHREGLKVHAWINAMPVWRDETPPKDARHVFNLHGPSAAGDQCWLTSSREGVQKFPVGYFLDPGHPAAQEHLVRVYLDLVRRYGVDGIHFDYIRYPETAEVLPRGSNVGYNPVSVRRFQRSTGRSDVPDPADEQWTAWRRRQVTELVRRISIEARATNASIVVGAATIAWGKPPATLADFSNTAPMQRIFQNWQAWLVEGLLDLACPMNYAREHDQRVREWFNGWIAWEKRHKARRLLIVGVGGYLNTAENVLAQIARARTRDGKRAADGTSIFSYFRPVAVSLTANPESASAADASAPDRFDFLVGGAGSASAAYQGPVPVPAVPWVERPTTGFLAGAMTGAEGRPVDGATVQVRRTGIFRSTTRVTSDGNGWFGATQLKPGTYRVRQELPGGRAASTSVEIEVRAGRVARVSLAAQSQ
jgi:uncharacterized lipoprotein YddW (UPF0748 family)